MTAPFDSSLDPGDDLLLEDEELEEELGDGPMDPEEVQRVVSQAVEDARSFIDTELSPRRAKATKYYNGELFGNEEEGRSQVVSTDVRDVIQNMMPGLMRMFTGSDAVVRYKPNGAAQEQQAKHATKLANTVFMEENPGFNNLYSALKDALLKDLGIIKWWWEDEEVEASYSLTGLSQEAVALLEQQPGTEITTMIPNPLNGTFDVEIIHRNTDGRMRIEALPPEEFLYTENARSLKEAMLVAHRTSLRRHELVAMGIDPEFLDEHGGSSTDLETNDEAIQRSTNQSVDSDEGVDDDTRKIEYIEAYMELDVDGDDIAEPRRIILIGTGMAIWEDIPWTGRPFALFIPDPEPHTLQGLGMFDYIWDIQRIKSSILRASLDSLAFAINPRTVIVENAVNYSDVLNTEIGATIREKAPGMVREFAHTYVGKEAFPMLGYLDEQKENRSGTSKAAAGLDPDALQSSTKTAVAATVAGSKQHLELTARIFAENGMTELFTGILEMLVQHQGPRMANVPGEGFVELDPSPWDVTMKVDVEVALGTDEEMVQTLMATAANQKAILDQYGLQNPMVTVAMYRDTLARLVELGGMPGDLFYQQVDPNWQPPPPPPPPPTTEEAFIMVETMKAQTNVITEQMKNQTSLIETLLKEDRERDRIEVDAMLRLLEIEGKFDKDFDETMIKNIMERGRNDIAAAQIKSTQEIEASKLELAQVQQRLAQAQQPPQAPGAAPNG